MAGEETRRPNVLCIVTDQQRADHLGCAGNPLIQTPNVDRLAASGARFERAYVHNPICSPSRSTMWTGLSVRGHRVRGCGMPLDRRIPTVPSALAEAGYRTHGVGKFHLTPTVALNGADPRSLNPAEWPEAREMWESGLVGALATPYYGLQSALLVGGHGEWFWGDYKRWLLHEAPEVIKAISDYKRDYGANWRETRRSFIPAELHHSHWIADRVIESLREQSQTQQPFFCWCSFPDPHHPYLAPDPYFSMYGPDDMPTPARREGELDDLPPHYRIVQNTSRAVEGAHSVARYYHQTPEIMARTYAMVSNIDANVGRVLDALDSLGMRENTIIVYLSDHGDMMGDHWLQQKGPFHFQGLIRVPYIWSWPGHIAAGKVHTGIASILDLAPTILDFCGVPIPEGPRPVEPIVPREGPPWPGHSLKPILEGSGDNVRNSALVDQDDDFAGLRARTLVTERYRITCYAGQPYGELFDLQEDPQELHNLWDDPGYRMLRYELAVQLLDEVGLHESRFPRRLAGA